MLIMLELGKEDEDWKNEKRKRVREYDLDCTKITPISIDIAN